MTIREAIDRTDAVKPNSYSPEEKVRWLAILDGMVKNEIIDTHEGGELVVFVPYTASTLVNTVLLIAEPYAQEVYPAWLAAQIDFANEEIPRYNNDMQAYNAAYDLYCRWYNRTHTPLQRNKTYTYCGVPQKPKTDDDLTIEEERVLAELLRRDRDGLTDEEKAILENLLARRRDMVTGIVALRSN